MDNKKYWEERANLRMETYHKNSNETIFKINKAYDKAISDINKDIKKIFNKFQLDNELTQSEAKDLLNSKISIKEIEDIRAKINYIQDEDVKKYLRAKLDSGAYKARITRLEALKESININIAQVADVQLRDINTLFIDNIGQAYYSTMYDIQKGIGIGFSFAEMPTSRIKEILKQDWSGKHYSERVWKNNEVLAQKLQETLLSGFMSGKSYRRMAKELEDLSDLGKFASERLIRTECTYIANQGEIESYKECGIEKYVYVAILDLRTSEICRELDNKIFLVKEAMPGKNLPPMHPYCRSTTYAYMGKEWYEGIKRKARDPVTGELYTLPKNMSYKEWYQKFVVEKHGKDKADTMEKMIKNKSSDRKQYEEYKKILGKDVPKSLKEFQEMKYNNSTEWNKLNKLTKLSDDEKWAINRYISSDSYKINEKLRKGMKLTIDDEKFIKDLDSALSKIPKYTGDLTRSLQFYSKESMALFLESHKVTNTVTYKEYISTTKGDIYNENAQVQIYILDSTKGRDISKYNDGEQEILYERNVQFIIKEIEVINGVTHILMEEI